MDGSLSTSCPSSISLSHPDAPVKMLRQLFVEGFWRSSSSSLPLPPLPPLARLHAVNAGLLLATALKILLPTLLLGVHSSSCTGREGGEEEGGDGSVRNWGVSDPRKTNFFLPRFVCVFSSSCSVFVSVCLVLSFYVSPVFLDSVSLRSAFCLSFSVVLLVLNVLTESFCLFFCVSLYISPRTSVIIRNSTVSL